MSSGSHEAFLRTEPTAEQLAAIGAQLDLGALVAAARLRGGVSSSVHRVTFARGEVVLRRFNAEHRWFDVDDVRHEAALLGELEPSAVPAPVVLLEDAEGSRTGASSLVLTLVPGQPVSDPGVSDTAAVQLARALLGVHRLDTELPAPAWTAEWAVEDDAPPRIRDIPRAVRAWDAVRAVRDELAAEPQALVHNDYHVGNTLWQDGSLTGVVDWSSGGRGWPSLDAAYCAMDLAVCAGPHHGEALLDAYEEAAGRQVHPVWRLVAALRALPELAQWLPGWTDLGYDVTLQAAQRRLDGWVDDALARVGGARGGAA